jgi:hypothetical protein
LSDADSAVIRSFRILNEAIPKTSAFYGVPNPVTYIVGRDGTIQATYSEDDYRKRFTTGAILSEPAAGSESAVGGDARVDVRTSASDTVVRGGERVRLFVEIRLAQRVHVYAPGVAGYIPLDWRMEAGGGAEALPATYPKSELLHLKAIKETVPVFRNRIRLWQDVIIAQPKEIEQFLSGNRRLTLRGQLRYQACDDRKCYVPENMELKWIFRYEPHDSTRAPAELRRR